MIKILHTADLHLDSPFSSLPASQARRRREKLRSLFSSMTLYARTEGIDIMLIAGDLFDAKFVTRDTIDMIVSEIGKLTDTFVVIAPGNHDPVTPGSVWDKIKLPPNAYVFTSDALSKVSVPGKNVDVYGYAFTSNSLRKNPALGASVADPTRINILLAHTQLGDPLSEYAPISREQLAAFGADYAALGHVHNAEGKDIAGRCTYAYSGCPEGRSFDECGEKHALLVQIEKKDGVADVKVAPKPFTRRRFEIADVDLTGACDITDVREAIRGAVAGKGFDRDTALRLRLVGQTGRALDFSSVSDMLDVGSLELCDETLPIWNCALASDPTLRGQFYRAICPKLESADEHEREVAMLALRYTLSVMAGEDVPDDV